MKVLYIKLSCIVLICFSCSTKTESAHIKTTVAKTSAPKLSEEFKTYWYNGNAEISSYNLQQVRYGELRHGKAVLIFVTEDMLPTKQVKADNYSKNNVPVIKLNATKTFNTGIYPYHIMESTFFPVNNTQHALKISASIQEWCGQTYTQLNNNKQFNITSHSYFENEADESFSIKKSITENELWTKLRLNPKKLPVGTFNCIPSIGFTRLKHIPIKSYSATAKLTNNTYELYYKVLDRKLTLNFNPQFPYTILSWTETTNFSTKNTLTTTATLLKTLKSAYWSKNQNKHLYLRDSLQLN